MAAEAKQQDGLKELIGEKFLRVKGDAFEVVSYDDCIKDKVDLIGLYFSAHWCPPCRGFTPILKKTWDQWKKDGHKIQIIFGTRDQDKKAFESYFKEHGDYLAFDYEEKDKRINKLMEKYGVQGIPTLIILNKNGEVVDKAARGVVHNKEHEAIKQWQK
eukprot:CAMPEP_0201574984 /NCGR_PEP_ID=MMETSP0190_2-20130828/19864_1 /ASSEMBLY_ACC=CAM_ASM_000263 /TAXON_ID=37353 /ORGANISM="Rosalina sp." /LENGTH=158 /DNA_ID=CAMNT_0048004019 /DNA_START=85 /DNA_END=561 /DNA_ORIENTATION=+